MIRSRVLAIILAIFGIVCLVIIGNLFLITSRYFETPVEISSKTDYLVFMDGKVYYPIELNNTSGESQEIVVVVNYYSGIKRSKPLIIGPYVETLFLMDPPDELSGSLFEYGIPYSITDSAIIHFN